MSVFAYVRENLGGRPRIGVAMIQRIAFRLPPIVTDLILAFIVLVILLAAVNFAQADERRSPCLVFGQPVPCQNFISSNPDQNRIRDEDLARRVQRDRDRERRDQSPPGK
ncbi:MAG: hypothetical protein PSV22_12000 [Pseudolabrys sp.]|jgi:hypothetical protein|nr:hypothetical protein [Pseudolabrys sp.]